MTLSDFPISYHLLDKYRMNAKQSYRSSMIGGHLMRQKGQSLEFKEYKTYTLGDDIRYVDWRASSRLGTDNDLIIRNFMAEEHLKVLISIDTRDTMRYPEPENHSKLQIACWAAEAISYMTLISGNRVYLHRLFGKGKNDIFQLNHKNMFSKVLPALSNITRNEPDNELNLKCLARCLPPTAIWIILTDLYFDLHQTSEVLFRKIMTAQNGMRWVILVDLDSWPHEKTVLGKGARRIEGPGATSDLSQVDITENVTRNVEISIENHKNIFSKNVSRRGYDYDHWKWFSKETINPVDLFKTHFFNDKVLFSIFMKDY